MYSLESDKKCVKSDYFRSGSASEADGSDEVRFVKLRYYWTQEYTHTENLLLTDFEKEIIGQNRKWFVKNSGNIPQSVKIVLMKAELDKCFVQKYLTPKTSSNFVLRFSNGLQFQENLNFSYSRRRSRAILNELSGRYVHHKRPGRQKLLDKVYASGENSNLPIYKPSQLESVEKCLITHYGTFRKCWDWWVNGL